MIVVMRAIEVVCDKCGAVAGAECVLAVGDRTIGRHHHERVMAAGAITKAANAAARKGIATRRLVVTVFCDRRDQRWAYVEGLDVDVRLGPFPDVELAVDAVIDLAVDHDIDPVVGVDIATSSSVIEVPP